MQILNMWGDGIVDDIRAAAPDAEIVPVPGPDEFDPGATRGEVLFAMWFGHPVFDHLDEVGVRWMHLSGTGVDAWPRPLLEGRTVTCARGVSAIPISEFVLGAMLAFEKDMPNVWLDEPPEHWNLASLGELAGKTVGIVGLGGIGTAVARRALAFDMRVRALRRNPRATSPDGVEIVARPGRSARDRRSPRAGRTGHRGDAEPARRERVRPDEARRAPRQHRAGVVGRSGRAACGARRRYASRAPASTPSTPSRSRPGTGSSTTRRCGSRRTSRGPRRRPSTRIIGVVHENLRRYVAGEPLHGIVDPDEGY